MNKRNFLFLAIALWVQLLLVEPAAKAQMIPLLASLSGSGGGGGACSLSYTTNLSLWVKADTGLTCTSGCSGTHVVTAWADQSGNSNNLTTSSSTLTYAASDINSLPAVHFANTGGAPGPSSFTLTTPLTPSSVTIFAVVKASSGISAHNTLISGLTNSLDYFVNDNSSNFLQGALSNFTAILLESSSAQNTSYHQINFTGVSGTSQSLRQNRTADGSAANSTSFTGAAMTTIGYNAQAAANGCSGNSCNPLDGNLAELLIYSAALSGTNNTTVENYLNCRYGL